MKNKKIYTTYTPHTFSTRKYYKRKADDVHLFDELYNKKTGINEYDDSNIIRDYYNLLYRLWQRGYCESIDHIFLPSIEFCDWLANSHQEKNMENIRSITSGVFAQNVTLNFKTCSGVKSCLVSKYEVEFSDGIDDCFMFINKSITQHDVSLNYRKGYTPDVSACYHSLKDHSEENLVGSFEWIKNLYIGLCMYINAFPQSVKEGLPSNIKYNTFGINKKYHVKIDNNISGRKSDGHIAHYRSGHLRYLTHERYKKKRFKCVFVKGTFVKGKAKTVEA